MLLARPVVYRFGRDWSNPQVHFSLEPAGTYAGIAYSATSRSFWLTRRENGRSLIEEWSSAGEHLATPVTVPAAIFTTIASDPRDGTLWVARQQAGLLRLENFDVSGRHLSVLEVESPHPFLAIGGMEFAWIPER
jgi:ligand-binding sensor domain-containing protein